MLWLLAAALLWVVAVRNWRMSVTLTESAVRHQGWWRRQEVPWNRVASIEFLGGRSKAPAVPVIHSYPTSIALSACENCGHRMRLEQAALLAEAASRRGISVRLEPGPLARWSWRGAEFLIQPD
jgi:hypothetical protein